MVSLRRGRRVRTEKHKPEIVTGNFELHYEDVIQRNRFVLIALFASGLVLLTAFIPSAVYRSIADTDQVSIEVEKGVIVHPELVNTVSDDVSASGNSYIEFHVKPEATE
ncbi:hypothetical protein H0V99_03405 [Candidatus Saccharibacteria bacterium]|nr:hypothetical protein [Candidatus Saccharibacteria bacterium]